MRLRVEFVPYDDSDLLQAADLLAERPDERVRVNASMVRQAAQFRPAMLQAART